MTVPLTSTAHQISFPAGSPWSASRIAGSCSPSNTNSRALSTNVVISHMLSPRMRVSGVVSSGVCQPR